MKELKAWALTEILAEGGHVVEETDLAEEGGIGTGRGGHLVEGEEAGEGTWLRKGPLLGR